jgi:hypothetical protein
MVLIVRNNQLFFLWALPIQFIPIFFSPLAEVAVTLDWIRFCLNLVLINGLLLWCYRLYWQYQTFHLPSTSINRVEWFGDLAEKKRKWMAAGYTPGRIRWETLKYYKEIIRAGLTVIVIDTAVYDYWCQLRGWCTPDYEE